MNYTFRAMGATRDEALAQVKEELKKLEGSVHEASADVVYEAIQSSVNLLPNDPKCHVLVHAAGNVHKIKDEVRSVEVNVLASLEVRG